MKKIAFLLALVLLLTAFAGCSKSDPAPTLPDATGSNSSAKPAEDPSQKPDSDQTEALPPETTEPVYNMDSLVEEALSYFETEPEPGEAYVSYGMRNPMLAAKTGTDLSCGWEIDERRSFDSISVSVKGFHPHSRSNEYFTVDKQEGFVETYLTLLFGNDDGPEQYRDALADHLRDAGWTVEIKDEVVPGAGTTRLIMSAALGEENPAEFTLTRASSKKGQYATLYRKYPHAISDFEAMDQDYVYASLPEMAEKISDLLLAFPEEGETPDEYFARFPFRFDENAILPDEMDGFKGITQIAYPNQTKQLMDGTVVLDDSGRYITIKASVNDYESAVELYNLMRAQYIAWFAPGEPEVDGGKNVLGEDVVTIGRLAEIKGETMWALEFDAHSAFSLGDAYAIMRHDTDNQYTFEFYMKEAAWKTIGEN